MTNNNKIDPLENNSLLNNQNNDEKHIIISEENTSDETTEKEEETEESDTITNQEVDSDNDILEKDEYFSSIEDMYNFNIDAISSVNSIKSDINRRLMIRKLKLAKENNGLKLMFKILFSFFIFFYIKSCTNELLSQILLGSNLVEKGFIFKTTIFILKKLHIIVFLLFTNIGHIFFDILLLFFVEIIDVFIFILDRFDYDIITKEREIRKLKDNEENKDDDSNKDNSYMMIVIKGVLYIFVNGILVPLSMLLKSINKSIAISGDWFSDLFLSKKDLLIKRQPNMDIKKSRLINSLEGKQPTKDKNINKKRSLFDRLKRKIKEYLDNIVGKNDLLTNSLRGEGKKPRNSKITSRTLGVKEAKGKSKGKNTSKGKNKSRGRDGWERSLEGKERSSDGKGTEKDTTSKTQGKSGNNRGEVREGNERTRQETTTKSGQKKNDNSKSNLHDSTTIDNQSKKETVTQQGNSIKPDNLNQGIGAGNTTKTGDTVKESPKPTRQPSNFDFSNKKMSEDFINKIERYELLVNGKVYDFNKDGQCAGMPLDEAKKFAAERSKGLENLNKGEERLESFKEKENQSKNLGDKEQDRSKQVDEKGDQLGKNISEQKEKNIDDKKDDINKTYISESKKEENKNVDSAGQEKALAAAGDKKAKMALMRAKVAQAKEKIEQGQPLNKTEVKSTTNPLQGVNISADKKNTQTHMHKVNSHAHKPKSNNLPSR